RISQCCARSSAWRGFRRHEPAAEPETGCAPLPLVGRGWGWGSESVDTPRAITTTPLPTPPPQGGREQTESVAQLYSVRRRMLCSCLDPHARIDQAVEHVDQEVERDIHHPHGEHEALQRPTIRPGPRPDPA